MDQFQLQPAPVGEFASTLTPTTKEVNANNGTNIATSDKVASTRITPAIISIRGGMSYDVCVHLMPKLQLQEIHLETQIDLVLIFSSGDDPVPVERCAPRRLIPARSCLPHDT
jgi:hypothetical protein